jgi:aryl-alcohol dehydrogenase-like predicted oxidoreductase
MSDFISKISLGTAQFGMKYGINNKNGKVNANEVRSILDFAHENNINTLDTAKAYGSSEKFIGEYIKKTEKLWNIITKVNDGDKTIVEQVQDSIDKLTIKPTIVLAHSANLFLDPMFQSKLQETKDKELVHSIGVSLYSEEEINQVLESELKPEVIQLPMNILDTRLYRSGVLSKLFDREIEIHVRSAFLQGLFYLSKAELEDGFKDAIPYLKKLKSISADIGLTLSGLSLLWLVSLKEVSKVIIGVDNVNQLKNHLDTLKKNIDSSVFKEALSIHYENENILNPSFWPSKS